MSHNNRKLIHSPSPIEQVRELDAYFDEQLRKGPQACAADQKRSPVSVKRWIGRISGVMLLVVLPFFVLMRTSVYLYDAFHLNGWIALAGGVTATVLLLLVYVLFVNRRLAGSAIRKKYLLNGVLMLVLAYCCYGLVYISGMNVKHAEIRSYYRTLHPILRITLTTTTLADQQLVITDMQRFPEDYTAMGLPLNEQSLHYMQRSGYVHAVDIRTRGRAEWKNWVTQGLFRLAGLRAIRHVGTADHLHVYLPVTGRKTL